MTVQEEVKEAVEQRFKQEIPPGWYIRKPETLKYLDIPEVIEGATDVWNILGGITPHGDKRYTYAQHRGAVTAPPENFLDNYIRLEDPINYMARLEDSLTEAVKTFRSMSNVRFRSGPSQF